MSAPQTWPDSRDLPERPLYFFLSYARLGPVGEDPDESGSVAAAAGDRDREVEKFFTALDKRVTELVRGPAGSSSGFWDGQVSYQPDPRAALAEALGRAQVFVALYSASYLETSWTRRELEAFRRRIEGQGVEAASRVVPLLWTPVPQWLDRPETEAALKSARSFATDLADYAEGIRALCMLKGFEATFPQVVDRVAKKVVKIARGRFLASSAVEELAEVAGHHVDSDDPSCIVTVLTAADEHGQGEGISWHPYQGRQTLPVAEYAARMAERRGMAPRLVEFGSVAASSRENPVVALIDPQVLSEAGGEAELKSAFERLPLWVYPLVVTDRADVRYQGGGLKALADRAKAVLSASVPATALGGRRAVDLAAGPDDLESKVPLALAKARQTYLTYGTYSASTPLARRRLLSRGGDDA